MSAGGVKGAQEGPNKGQRQESRLHHGVISVQSDDKLKVSALVSHMRGVDRLRTAHLRRHEVCQPIREVPFKKRGGRPKQSENKAKIKRTLLLST